MTLSSFFYTQNTSIVIGSSCPLLLLLCHRSKTGVIIKKKLILIILCTNINQASPVSASRWPICVLLHLPQRKDYISMYDLHDSINYCCLSTVLPSLSFCFWQKPVDVVGLCLQWYCIDLPVGSIKE